MTDEELFAIYRAGIEASIRAPALATAVDGLRAVAAAERERIASYCETGTRADYPGSLLAELIRAMGEGSK